MRLKSVRGDRTEDIIFNGNTKRPPVSLADVVLTLGNEEELVILTVFFAREKATTGLTVNLSA
jgi:chromosome segregation ATPase